MPSSCLKRPMLISIALCNCCHVTTFAGAVLKMVTPPKPETRNEGEARRLPWVSRSRRGECEVEGTNKRRWNVRTDEEVASRTQSYDRV